MNDQSITTQKLFIHCLSIGTATSNLSDHPPFLGSPGDEIGKIIPTQSSQRKEYTLLHVYSNYPLACHCLSMSLYMSTQQVREEALLNIRCIAKGYHLCRFEVNVREVFCFQCWYCRKIWSTCIPVKGLEEEGMSLRLNLSAVITLTQSPDIRRTAPQFIAAFSISLAPWLETWKWRAHQAGT